MSWYPKNSQLNNKENFYIIISLPLCLLKTPTIPQKFDKNTTPK